MRVSAVLALPLMLAGFAGLWVGDAPEAAPGAFHGTFDFSRAWLDGKLVMSSDTGVLRIDGPYSFDLTASRIEVRHVRVNKTSVNNPLAGDVSLETGVRSENYSFADGRIVVEGAGELGLAYAFQDEGGVLFEVATQRAVGDAFHVVDTTQSVIVTDPGQPYAFSHAIEPPAFGVSSGDRPGFRLTPNEVSVRGTVDIALDYANVTMSGAEGDARIETGYRRLTTTAPLGLYEAAYTVERSWAFVHLENATGRLLTMESGVELLTGSPTYRLEGTLVVPAERGTYDGPQVGSVSGQTVEMRGNFTVRLAHVATRSGMLPLDGPSTHQRRAEVWGDQNATVFMNGVLLSAPPEPVQQASLAAIALGLLAVAWGTLQKVLAPVFLPLYSRLIRRDLLGNVTRLRIFELVSQEPFLHAREIKRRTRLGHGTVAYHLDMLKKQRFIAGVRRGRHEFFFAPIEGFKLDDMKRLARLGHSQTRRVAEFVCDQRTATQEQVAAALRIDRAFASRQLKRLCDASLVEPGTGWPRGYMPTPLLKAWQDRRTPAAAAMHGTSVAEV